MNSFTIFYTFLGGLGLFFYGMKTMSDALQATTGDFIQRTINSLTRNRIMAVSVGAVVTIIIQSSSVTTVMVVGLVNAGLMQLSQAIGVILGANIGTTITGWIISIKVSHYGPLLIGIGIIPTLFLKSEKAKNIGQTIFGVGLIFFGLQTMSDGLRPLRESAYFLELIQHFSGHNYSSYIAATVVGCLFTVVVQSSSAMLAITIALATTSVISFHTAVALVLGENIGTTITAFLASVGGNVNAKRAARAHSIFNIVGVLIVLALFPKYVEFINWLLPGDANFVDSNGDRPNIAQHIATAHSIFNISATIIFLPFINYLSKLVTVIVPDGPKKKEEHHLTVLGNPNDILPATGLYQATEELKKLKDIVSRMFQLSLDYLEQEELNPKIRSKIKHYEIITDNIQKEITIFTCKIMEKALTQHQSLQSQVVVRLADELESIADYLEKISFLRERLKADLNVNGESTKKLLEYGHLIFDYFHLANQGMNSNEVAEKSKCERLSHELRIRGDELRDLHIHGITQGLYSQQSAMTYSDMIVAFKKIRSHSLNMSQNLYLLGNSSSRILKSSNINSI